jgi:hypothetical protein
MFSGNGGFMKASEPEELMAFTLASILSRTVKVSIFGQKELSLN